MELVIRPQKRLSLNLKELWAYRELFYVLAWRDIRVRYKQTVIGGAWAILQPVGTMVIFTLLFNKVAGISSGDTPYAIFSFAGLIYWNYFQNAMNGAASSVLANQPMVTKIYFPRLILPLSATIVFFLDFLLAFLVFVALLLYFQITPSILGVALIVPLLILSFLTAAGVGMFFGAVNVKYRDVKHVLPFLTQTLLFITPVVYPINLVPDKYQWILYLNPMTGIITAVRATFLGQGTIEPNLMALSIAMGILAFFIGLTYFRSKEREFADIV